MAHMMKHTKAACGHMFAHFDRGAENISNENLDRTRSHLNYNLATHQQMDQGEFVKQRCSEVRCQNRKDVNVMVSWVVTAPQDLPPAEQKDFFKASYDFLENRYGKDNVVSAYVHMDETTPHMHFAFVPVTFDQKKDCYKVSAKEVVGRRDLQTFHGDLQKAVESALGHEVGILNEATKEGNRSIKELKQNTAMEKLKGIESEIEARENVLERLATAQNDLEIVKGRVQDLGEQETALKGQIQDLNQEKNAFQSSIDMMASMFGSRAELDKKLARAKNIDDEVKMTEEQLADIKADCVQTSKELLQSKAELDCYASMVKEIKKSKVKGAYVYHEAKNSILTGNKEAYYEVPEKDMKKFMKAAKSLDVMQSSLESIGMANMILQQKDNLIQDAKETADSIIESAKGKSVRMTLQQAQVEADRQNAMRKYERFMDAHPNIKEQFEREARGNHFRNEHDFER